MARLTIDESDVTTAEVVGLYDAVGWTAYTRDPGSLMKALANSHRVLAARSQGVLVGLCRVVSDGETICYVQDLLVHPDHQGAGLGTRLLEAMLEHYRHVRQRVLLTDDEPAQRAFYTACGFVDSTEHTGGPLHAFVKFA